MPNLKSWIPAVCFMLILLVRQSISLALPMGQAIVEIVARLEQDHVRRDPASREPKWYVFRERCRLYRCPHWQ